MLISQRSKSRFTEQVKGVKSCPWTKEIEAYRNLMEILGIEYPKEKEK